jgi:hypothetical protein
MTDTVSNLDWWITRVGDGAVVWALCVGLAVFVRLDRKCWSWAELALLVLVVSTSGALYWCLALSLSVFTILVIDSLNIWQWPSVPPSAELDEIFPEQKDLIAQFRESAIRNEHYALRYGTITALAMAAVLVLFQLPKCPSDPWRGTQLHRGGDNDHVGGRPSHIHQASKLHLPPRHRGPTWGEGKVK